MNARYTQAGPSSAERDSSTERDGPSVVHHARAVNEPERARRAREEIARWRDGRDPRHGGFEAAS